MAGVVYPEAHMMIIRHGSKHRSDYWPRGDWNVRLSTGGEQESKDVGNFLQKYAKAWDIGTKETVAFTSPYKRPMQTAAPWVYATGVKLKVERSLGETGAMSEIDNAWCSDMKIVTTNDKTCNPRENSDLKQLMNDWALDNLLWRTRPHKPKTTKRGKDEKTFNYVQCDQEIARHVRGKGASVWDMKKRNDMFDLEYWRTEGARDEVKDMFLQGFKEKGHHQIMKRMKIARKAVMKPIKENKARMVVVWAHKGVVNGLAGWSSRDDSDAISTFGQDYYDSKPWPAGKHGKEAGYDTASMIILHKIDGKWTFFGYRLAKPENPFIPEFFFPEPANPIEEARFALGPLKGRPFIEYNSEPVKYVYIDPSHYQDPQVDYSTVKGVFMLGDCRYLFQECSDSEVYAAKNGEKLGLYASKCNLYAATPETCHEVKVRWQEPYVGGNGKPPKATQLKRESCSNMTPKCAGETQLRSGFKCQKNKCVAKDDKTMCCEPKASILTAEDVSVEVSQATEIPTTHHLRNALLTALILGSFVILYYYSQKRSSGDSLEEYFLNEFDGME